LGALADLARQAAGGEAGTLLVTGEAGVGKTALLREACHRVGGDLDVLWAGCLPLTSLAVPFLPLTSALREWAAQGVPVPALARAAGSAPDGGPVEFDAWLDGTCRRRPVLLVVDDLHWADQSTLDVLMYVVAGPARRRLAVAATVRAGEVGAGHPLRRWLADVRRLPGVTELVLGRLDRLATAQQLAGLLGGPPHESLVDDLFARTRGNAYLTTLLARRLPPDATSLPAGLPRELRDAVGYAWQRLSPPAREPTRLIAVAGRPQRADGLGEVATAAGLAGEVVPLLREAVDGGVLEVDADGRYWFVHPLLAEVLEDGLLPDERRALHAAFAAVLEPLADRGDEAGADRVIDLADHHFRAGHVEEAYRWALRGAEAAERAGGGTEMLRLLPSTRRSLPR
jgi:predicted ATPase